MARRHPVLKYRYLYDFAVVVAAFVAGVMQVVWVIALIFLVIAGLSVVITRLEIQQSQIQPKSHELNTLLESEILPRLHKNCTLAHPDEIPDLRVNVMLLRRRGLNPWRKDFIIMPWERTLQIEASYIGPEADDYQFETELEWKVDQGVVGDAMNERAEEVWTSEQYEDIDPRVLWNLSETQYNRTKHLNSVLSCPIYLPSDEENVNPVGVVNLDSERDIRESRFNTDEIRDEVIYWSNVIGAIVE